MGNRYSVKILPAVKEYLSGIGESERAVVAADSALELAYILFVDSERNLEKRLDQK